MAKLFLIRGVSGMGKSTLAQAIIDCGHAHVKHEADDYFMVKKLSGMAYEYDGDKIGAAHAQCQGRVKRDLAAGLNVIVSNTMVNMKSLKPYIKMAQGLGCEMITYNATGGTGNIHNVPEEALQRMRDNWQTIGWAIDMNANDYLAEHG